VPVLYRRNTLLHLSRCSIRVLHLEDSICPSDWTIYPFSFWLRPHRLSQLHRVYNGNMPILWAIGNGRRSKIIFTPLTQFEDNPLRHKTLEYKLQSNLPQIHLLRFWPLQDNSLAIGAEESIDFPRISRVLQY
jgi:hypothetical protein